MLWVLGCARVCHDCGMILERYLVGQVLKTVALCVCGFVGILLAGNALRDILAHFLAGRITFLELGTLLGLLVPNVLPYALPMGVVCGFVMVAGRLSADEEWVAMQALGLGPWRCFRPLAYFLLGCTLFTLGLHTLVLPKMAKSYRWVLKESLHGHPERFLEAGQFIRHFPGYLVYFRKKELGTYRDFCLWKLDTHNALEAVLCAQTATLESTGQEGRLRMVLHEGYAQYQPHQGPKLVFFKKLPLELPLGRMASLASEQQQLRFMSPKALYLASKTAHAAGRFQEAMRYRLHLGSLMVLSVSLVPLGLLAFGLGLHSRRSEASAGALTAIVLTLLYYASIMLISGLSAYPSLRPDWLLWLPNVALLIGGMRVLK